MLSIDLNTNPETAIFINDRRSSLESCRKEHISSVGKTTIFLIIGVTLAGLLNTDVVAILFFAVVSAIICMRLSMTWLLFPLIGFYGTTINYDGNSLSFTLISMAACLAMSWFLCQWMMAMKETGGMLKEKIKLLSFSDDTPDFDKLDSISQGYCRKVVKLNRGFTNGELESIRVNEEKGV